MVTHDQAEAMTMASRIAIMDRGSLVQVGRPQEVYEFPTNYYAANFLGQANFFTVNVQENESKFLKLVSEDVPCQFVRKKGVDASPGQSLRVGIRPEKITISKTKPADYDVDAPVNCLEGRVDNIAYLGGVSTYYVVLENGQTVKVTDFNVERQSDHPTWDDEVYLTWFPESMMVLTS
jgi:putrescine transport system ATP-binding protein